MMVQPGLWVVKQGEESTRGGIGIIIPGITAITRKTEMGKEQEREVEEDRARMLTRKCRGQGWGHRLEKKIEGGKRSGHGDHPASG